MGSGVEELAGPDPLGHVLGFRAIHAPVLELDHGVLALPRELLDLAPIPQWFLHHLVVDPLLVQRLLHFPARVRADLDPHQRAAMKLDGHRRRSYPSPPCNATLDPSPRSSVDRAPDF